MMLRALLISSLTAAGIWSSPIIPADAPSTHAAQSNYHIEGWGLKAQGQMQLSGHSKNWWRRQFYDNAKNNNQPEHFVGQKQSSKTLYDFGDILLRETEQGLKAETLISTPYNETLRYSLLLTELTAPVAPKWWPKAFEFQGGLKLGQTQTAYGRVRNNKNLIKHLPPEGGPWVQMSEDFYFGKNRHWWAFAEKGEIRIIKHIKDTQ